MSFHKNTKRMTTLNDFKAYLLQDKGASVVTIKNYLADIRKFIRWFEEKFQQEFQANTVTKDIAAEYKSHITGSENAIQGSLASQRSSGPTAARSAKRYLSSLKKFFSFTQASGIT